VEGSDTQEMYAQFEQLLEGHTIKFRPGTVVQGQVVGWNRKFATIEIGGKGHAHLPIAELSCAPIKNVRFLHGPVSNLLGLNAASTPSCELQIKFEE
jgi:ribosomal protein S1